MNKCGITIVLVLSFLLFGQVSQGEELKPQAAAAAAAMEAVGFSPYPGSVFCIGTVEMGMRFATAESPEVVRTWFVESLPSWVLLVDEELGTWTLFDGPPETKRLMDIMVLNHVTVQANENLPAWHSLAKNMTTEILVALPRQHVEKGEPLLEIPASDHAAAPGLIRTAKPEGVVGQLNQGEDMQTPRGGSYFYLQDEDYNEYTVAYEADLDVAMAQKLNSISTTYESLRIVGDVLADEASGIYCFDRAMDIQIFPAD